MKEQARGGIQAEDEAPTAADGACARHALRGREGMRSPSPACFGKGGSGCPGAGAVQHVQGNGFLFLEAVLYRGLYACGVPAELA